MPPFGRHEALSFAVALMLRFVCTWRVAAIGICSSPPIWKRRLVPESERLVCACAAPAASVQITPNIADRDTSERTIRARASAMLHPSGWYGATVSAGNRREKAKVGGSMLSSGWLGHLVRWRNDQRN